MDSYSFHQPRITMFAAGYQGPPPPFTGHPHSQSGTSLNLRKSSENHHYLNTPSNFFSNQYPFPYPYTSQQSSHPQLHQQLQLPKTEITQIGENQNTMLTIENRGAIDSGFLQTSRIMADNQNDNHSHSHSHSHEHLQTPKQRPASPVQPSPTISSVSTFIAPPHPQQMTNHTIHNSTNNINNSQVLLQQPQQSQQEEEQQHIGQLVLHSQQTQLQSHSHSHSHSLTATNSNSNSPQNNSANTSINHSPQNGNSGLITNENLHVNLNVNNLNHLHNFNNNIRNEKNVNSFPTQWNFKMDASHVYGSFENERSNSNNSNPFGEVPAHLKPKSRTCEPMTELILPATIEQNGNKNDERTNENGSTLSADATTVNTINTVNTLNTIDTKSTEEEKMEYVALHQMAEMAGMAAIPESVEIISPQGKGQVKRHVQNSHTNDNDNSNEELEDFDVADDERNSKLGSEEKKAESNNNSHIVSNNNNTISNPITSSNANGGNIFPFNGTDGLPILPTNFDIDTSLLAIPTNISDINGNNININDSISNSNSNSNVNNSEKANSNSVGMPPLSLNDIQIHNNNNSKSKEKSSTAQSDHSEQNESKRGRKKKSKKGKRGRKKSKKKSSKKKNNNDNDDDIGNDKEKSASLNSNGESRMSSVASVESMGGQFSDGYNPFRMKIHFCTQCKKSFVQKCHLMRHIREQHSTTTPVFICKLCSKSFNQKSNLKVHLRGHAQDQAIARPWTCQNCNPFRRFTRKSSLKRHWQTKHKDLYEQLSDDLDRAEAVERAKSTENKMKVNWTSLNSIGENDRDNSVASFGSLADAYVIKAENGTIIKQEKIDNNNNNNSIPPSLATALVNSNGNNSNNNSNTISSRLPPPIVPNFDIDMSELTEEKIVVRDSFQQENSNNNNNSNKKSKSKNKTKTGKKKRGRKRKRSSDDSMQNVDNNSIENNNNNNPFGRPFKQQHMIMPSPMMMANGMAPGFPFGDPFMGYAAMAQGMAAQGMHPAMMGAPPGINMTANMTAAAMGMPNMSMNMGAPPMSMNMNGMNMAQQMGMMNHPFVPNHNSHSHSHSHSHSQENGIIKQEYNNQNINGPDGGMNHGNSNNSNSNSNLNTTTSIGPMNAWDPQFTGANAFGPMVGDPNAMGMNPFSLANDISNPMYGMPMPMGMNVEFAQQQQQQQHQQHQHQHQTQQGGAQQSEFNPFAPMMNNGNTNNSNNGNNGNSSQ